MCKKTGIMFQYVDEASVLKHTSEKKSSVLNPKEFNPDTIGWYHREMFRLHDLKKWDKLKQNAREMIIALGYEPENSEKASWFVLEAYQNADFAAKAQKLGNNDEEDSYYDITLNNFLQASKSVNSNTAGIEYKIGWYKFERHKKPFLVAYYLFQEHLKRFGVLRLDVVICTTWIAFWGGYFAHEKHDWEKLESVMVKYWKHIHKVFPIRPPLQI